MKKRSNHAPYMTKASRKAIMKQSEFETTFYKTKSVNYHKVYNKKTKNVVRKLYKKEKFVLKNCRHRARISGGMLNHIYHKRHPSLKISPSLIT